MSRAAAFQPIRGGLESAWVSLLFRRRQKWKKRNVRFSYIWQHVYEKGYNPGHEKPGFKKSPQNDDSVHTILVSGQRLRQIFSKTDLENVKSKF